MKDFEMRAPDDSRQYVIVSNLLFDSQHGFACDKDEIDQRDFLKTLFLLFFYNILPTNNTRLKF